MKIYPLILALFLAPWPAAAGDKAPWDNSSLLYDLTQAPAIPYVSEEEQEKTLRKMQEADAVGTGILADAVLVRLGLEGPPVPLVRVSIEDLRLYKGEEPPAGTFLYRGPPDRLKALRNRKVIVLLQLPRKGSGETILQELIPAYKENLELIARLQGASGTDCAPEADACTEEV